jgi:hypothetical protein
MKPSSSRLQNQEQAPGVNAFLSPFLKSVLGLRHGNTNLIHNPICPMPDSEEHQR